MVDELIYSELAKSFAATGHFLVRDHSARGVPALVDQAQGGCQALGVSPGPGHPPGIRRDDGQIVLKILPDIGNHDGGGVEIVHRNIEKALDLPHVQIHGEDALGPGGGQQVGHQLGGDGHPGRHLAVLAGIAEIGDDRGDPPGRGPFHRVDHDQEFHQVVVGGRAGGLDQEDVPAPDIIGDFHPDLAVTEGADHGLAQGQGEVVADFVGQFGEGIARKDTNIVIERGIHRSTRFRSPEYAVKFCFKELC